MEEIGEEGVAWEEVKGIAEVRGREAGGRERAREGGGGRVGEGE